MDLAIVPYIAERMPTTTAILMGPNKQSQHAAQPEVQKQNSETSMQLVTHNVGALQPAASTPKGISSASKLNLDAVSFQFPTPEEAYSTRQATKSSPISPLFPLSPVLQPSILPNRAHTFLQDDTGLNDSDYYQESLGSDDLGYDNDEGTDEHSYEELTDGSEGTHAKKCLDRRKLKAASPSPLLTIEDLKEQ